MKSIFLFCIIIILVTKVNGQSIVTDLYGFRIGQYRETATNELGTPMVKDVYEDGFEYEVFLLKPDTSLYLVFEYAVGYTDQIWSIQISGANPSAETGFKNLKMGTSSAGVEKITGVPGEKVDIGEYGERWEYKNANYTFEISKEGLLTSIKIKNTWLEEKPDIKKLPVFKNVIKKLLSKKNTDLAQVLSPQLEIYYQDKVLFFGKSLKTEIEMDYSGVFATVRELVKGLDKINVSDPNVYEENMRMVAGQHPMHVIKINSGSVVKEIVFQYINGEYRVWEIKTG